MEYEAVQASDETNSTMPWQIDRIIPDTDEPIFHITVGCGIVGKQGLEHELRMVKAALLYADQVKLCSLRLSPMIALRSLDNLTSDERRELLDELAESHLAKYKQIKITRKEMQLSSANSSLIGTLHEAEEDVEAEITENSNNPIVIELLQANRMGLLEPHIFGAEALLLSGKLSLTRENILEEFTKLGGYLLLEFVTIIRYILSNCPTYPLFDEKADTTAKKLLKRMSATSEATTDRGKQIKLAANLLGRLPLFDTIPIDELLDIRKELSKPLIRFRGAMIGFSQQIKGAAWDKDFPLEAEQVFHQHVAPAVLDIEEEVRSNRYLAKLVDKAVTQPLVVPSGSVFALVLSNMTSMPSIVSQALGLGVSASLLAHQAYQEWQQEQDTIEQKQLFFYYKAGELLRHR